MMPIKATWMRSNSIQMEDTFFPVVMTQQWRSGTWGRVTSCTLSMATREQPLQMLSHLVEITSPQVVVTQLLWSGRATLKKMNKSTSKILEPKLERPSRPLRLLQEESVKNQVLADQDLQQLRRMNLQTNNQLIRVSSLINKNNMHMQGQEGTTRQLLVVEKS